MGTTAQKLEYLGETKTLLRTNINALGGSIDNNTTFREYADELDNIWEGLPHLTGSGTSLSISNTKKGKMKVNLLGNTSQTGTPTPDNPIPVNVVSGDNEVVVCGKNLLPLSASDLTYNAYIDNSGNYATTTSGNYYASAEYIDFDYAGKTMTLSAGLEVTYYRGDKTFIGFTHRNQDRTVVVPNNTKYIRIDSYKDNINEIMINLGETALPYEPYQSTSYPINLGELELCKIGTYQDKFIRNSGKNIIDIKYKNGVVDLVVGENLTNTQLELNLSSAVGKTYITTGGYFKAGTYTLTNYSATYLSFNRIAIAGTNCVGSSTHLRNSYTWTQYVDGYTYFGLEGDAGETSYTDTQIANELLLMVNEGSTALPYEPYGTNEWYKESKIGEKTLVGTEQYTQVSYAFLLSETLNPASETALCTHFTYSSAWTSSSEDYRGKMNFSSGKIRFMPLDSSINTTELWKTWLSNNNIKLIYPLATPTYTKITGTLEEQLENVWRANSYNGQTNISQINNDLQFNLDYTALESE